MCGFVGFFDPNKSLPAAKMRVIVLKMAATLESRGPDDEGSWVDAEAGIALGHRRLSIIDLSQAGHQPMVSGGGRFVIAYNGEVYNFAELRRELENKGGAFRGGSDTEVVLAAVEAWGVEAAVKRFIGMFSFAIWDRECRSITLVRDRLGIKPLYWGWSGEVLFFGSQPGAFSRHPAWTPEIDRDALAAYLRHNYVPGPRSIFRGVEKLEPGCLVEIGPDRTVGHRRYWDLRAIARDGIRNRSTMSDSEAVESLEQLLRDAVKRRMVADVPLGVFLSGGIDSSTVAALMQAQCDRPVKSFSIGFHEEGYNEAEHAKAVARHLGTDHTELYVESDHVLEALQAMARYYDEPFADSSQIPTFLVSEMTRRHVTVALSGDGGDELFAGYNRYFWGDSLWRRFLRWPAPVRALGAGMIRALSPAKWDRMFGMLPSQVRPPQAGDKMYKLADVLSIGGQEALYRRLVSQWENPDEVIRGAHEPKGILWDPTVRDDVPDFTERMQFLDTVTYLPDDILTKVDRASMAVSLEVRVPLLDHRVVEFAWRLPKAMKVRGGKGKWLLRQVLYKYVPQELVNRPKMGFGIPIDRWLRGELRDWAEDLLSEDRLAREGFFDPAPIRAKWAEHLSGRHNWQYPLWTVLMFQSWHETWRRG